LFKSLTAVVSDILYPLFLMCMLLVHAVVASCFSYCFIACTPVQGTWPSNY